MIYDIMTNEEKTLLFDYIKNKEEREKAKKEKMSPLLFGEYFEENKKAVKLINEVYKRGLVNEMGKDRLRSMAFSLSDDKRYELIDVVENFPIGTEAIVVNKKGNVFTGGFIVNNKLEDFKITFNVKKFSDVFKKRTKNITPMDKITNLHFK